VAKEIHGDLASHAGLIIGPGVAARSFAKALVVAGLGRLTVTAPASLDAEAFARAFSCHTAPFDRLEEALAGADIVVSAVGRHQHVMTLPLVERVLARRRQRPIFLLDAGEPGDIAAEVDDLESAFRYTLTDLEALAAGKNDREPLVLAAERIVDEEVEHFLRAQAERETLPPVRALRHRLEDLRESVLTEDGVLSADEATRRLVARIVEDPQDALRAAEEVPEERFNLERALRRLFQLPDIGTPRAPSRKSE
jgi:glutamyl-tRNA reductase